MIAALDAWLETNGARDLAVVREVLQQLAIRLAGLLGAQRDEIVAGMEHELFVIVPVSSSRAPSALREVEQAVAMILGIDRQRLA